MHQALKVGAPEFQQSEAEDHSLVTRLCAVRTLVAFPKGEAIVLYNYLARTAVKCKPDTLYWLSQFETDRNIVEVLDAHSHLSRQNLSAEILNLVTHGLLVESGSTAAKEQDNYQNNWKWGNATAIFHFASADLPFVSLEESKLSVLLKHNHEPSPPLYWEGIGKEVDATLAIDKNKAGLLRLMAARRSNRTVKALPVHVSDVAACAMAGLGITGAIETDTGKLPLSMTPSGGARNPYEAFIFAKNVTGLKPGIYHYEAISHRLTQLPHQPEWAGSNLVAGQDWADDMAATIMLVAVLERPMWKYQDSNAYRVTLVEAGHIGQNISLMATHLGMTACPTAALSHSFVRQCLNLSGPTHWPVYALLLGVPSEYDSVIEPNGPIHEMLASST